MKKWQETEKFLNKYGESVVKEQRTRLRNAGKFPGSKGGGPLDKSLSYKPFESKSEFGVNFYMEDYGVFVDKGVQGWKTGRTASGAKSPYKYKPKNKGFKSTNKRSKFIEALKTWAAKKGMNKNAAYPIRKKIWAEGIETTLFYTIPIVRSEKRFSEGIEKSMKTDLERTIQKRI